MKDNKLGITCILGITCVEIKATGMDKIVYRVWSGDYLKLCENVYPMDS